MNQRQYYQPQHFVHPPQGYANGGWDKGKKKRTEKRGWTIIGVYLLACFILGILFITGVIGTGESNPLPFL